MIWFGESITKSISIESSMQLNLASHKIELNQVAMLLTKLVLKEKFGTARSTQLN